MEKKKILVVEDDSVLRYVLMEKLKNTGYVVFGAEDGEVAIKKIKDEKPDLVLLDILMPKKDGMEVLEEMNVDEEMNSIPVIIISNSGQPVEIERAKKLGAKDFLIKAVFDPNEVLEKVKKLLNVVDVPIDNNDKEKNKMNNSNNKTLSNDLPQNPTPTDEPNKVVKKEATEVKGSKGKVLVVEDDKFLRELLVRKLFSGGFEVESTIDATGTFELGISNNTIYLYYIPGGEDAANNFNGKTADIIEVDLEGGNNFSFTDNDVNFNGRVSSSRTFWVISASDLRQYTGEP